MTKEASCRREPCAVTVLNERGMSPYILTCEHASNYIPAKYTGLGLADEDLERHIAWDLGASDLACRLSRLIDAPLVMSNYSRLLIDCNRPPGSQESIPARSEDTEVPGNRTLTPAEIAHREAVYFTPFHERVTGLLDERLAARRQTAIIGIHSFSPTYQGIRRIWHVGVLYGQANALASQCIVGFSRHPQLVVGDNEPYRVEPNNDYTVPMHGDARGIPAALIEVRNDLLICATDLEAWANRIAHALCSDNTSTVRNFDQS